MVVPMSDRPGRVVVLYNTDYDAELTAGTGTDVSAVAASATAVRDALITSGFEAELAGLHGLELFDLVGRLRDKKPDLVFNLCESMAGDARNEVALPAVFDLYGIPYTGSDALALGLALFKERTKDALRGHGVSTPEHRLLRSPADLTAEALAGLDYPWFLKLHHEDASVGIEADNVARDAAGLARRARHMMEEWKQPVLAERYIEGREINVTLIGNGADLEVMPLHEIDFSAMPPERPRIVSYAAKWDEAHVDYAGTKPVPLVGATPALIAAIERTARAAWAAVGLRDYGRVDLRVDAAGTPWVIDVNPNCDISPDAGVCRAARVAGLDYPALIERIALTAWRRLRPGPR
jgi:D-alanine-D-alanine ligase